jgi:hypothetical protein
MLWDSHRTGVSEHLIVMAPTQAGIQYFLAAQELLAEFPIEA